MTDTNGHSNRRLWAIVALAWSLSTAFVDVSFSLLQEPDDSSALSAVARLVVGDVAVFAAVFSTAALLAAVTPRRWLLTSRLTIALVAASAMGALLILAAPHNRMLSYFACQPQVIVCRPYATTFGISIAAATILLLMFGHAFAGATQRPSIMSMAIAAPLVSMIGTAAIWFVAYSPGATFGAVVAPVLAAIAAMVVAAFVAHRTARLDRELPALVGIVAFCGVVSLGAGRESTTDAARRSMPRLAAGSPKTVVLITIDTLRADGRGCYGNPNRTSPNIDRLASQGLLFENAMSPGPWTAPAMSALMTALDPLTVRMNGDSVLDKSVPTLGERMADAGYFTAGINTNTLAGAETGLTRGFDEYRLIRSAIIPNGALVMRLLWHDRFTAALSASDKGAKAVTVAALSTMRNHKDQPLFLWLHYLDVHTPYAPPPGYVQPNVGPTAPDAHFESQFVSSSTQLHNVRELYDGEVRYVDANIGRLFDEMRALGLYDSAAIFVTADHGDAHWEHGQLTHGPDLYSEVLRVPLIMKLPDLSNPRRLPAYVSSGSVMPTMLDLVHAAYDGGRFQWPSLMTVVDGAADPNGPVFSATDTPYEPKRAVVFDGWKYIESEATGRRELFNLVQDPHEQTSLTSQAPEQAEIGRQLLAKRRADGDRIRSLYRRISTPRRYDPERLRQLHALGYVQ